MQLMPKPKITSPVLAAACRCEWEDPYGGQCTDTFELSPCGTTLTQHTDMTIRSSGRRTQYRCGQAGPFWLRPCAACSLTGP